MHETDNKSGQSGRKKTNQAYDCVILAGVVLLSNAQALVAYWGFVQYGRCLRCLSGVETPKTEVCFIYLCAS